MTIRMFLIFVGTLLCSLLTQCTKNVPYASSVSQPDYNGRITVSAPVFKQELSLGGWAVTAGSVAAGAYLGSQTNLIKFNGADHQTTSNQVLNATVGGLIGFGVASLGNYMIGKQDRIMYLGDYQSLQTWAKNFRQDYIPVSRAGGQPVQIIDSKKANTFEVKKFQDAVDFSTAFPNSSQKESIVAQAIHVAARSELLDLLKLYPNSIHQTLIQKNYIQRSSTLNALLDALEQFPNTGIDVEEQAARLVAHIEDANRFKRKFGNSAYQKVVVDKFVNSDVQEDLAIVIQLFSTAPNIANAQKQYINIAKSVSDLMQASRKYPNLYTSAELEQKAFNRVSNIKTAHEFMTAFPKSSHLKRSILSSIEQTEGCFVGTLQNGSREGKGYFIANDLNYTYEGEWRNNKREGQGSDFYKFMNSTYTGSFKADRYEGYGKYVANYTYEGYFHEGAMHGKGTLRSRDALGKNYTYAGEFYNEQAQGKGKMSYDDGTWYEGYWSNWQRNGTFEVRFKDGLRMYGTWRDDKPVGSHKTKKWALGGLLTTYEGTIEFDSNGKVIGTQTQSDIFANPVSISPSASGSASRMQQQCDRCEVAEQKYINKNNYKVVMRNRTEYDCAYEDGRWIIKGWIFDDKFDSLNDLLDGFVQKCKMEYCK